VIIVSDPPAYEQQAISYMQDKTDIRVRNPEELGRYLSYYPHTYPCLVEFYVTTHHSGRTYVAAVDCIKKTAKSIVYPRTNVCKDNHWHKLNTAAGYGPIVKQIAARYICKFVTHVSKREMASISEKKESFLIRGIPYGLKPWENGSSNGNGKGLIMFLLKKEDAKKLVYYKKKREELKKMNLGAWKKNVAKKTSASKVERLLRLYKGAREARGLEEDDIQY